MPKWWAPMTRIVSYVWAFDLYNFRSKLRQYPGAISIVLSMLLC